MILQFSFLNVDTPSLLTNFWVIANRYTLLGANFCPIILP